MANTRAGPLYEALEDRERHFRAVAETAVDSIMTVDGEGRIVFWNPAAQVVFGYSAEEALGQPLTFLIPDAQREAHDAGLRLALQQGSLQHAGRKWEFVACRKGGAALLLELSFAAWSGKR